MTAQAVRIPLLPDGSGTYTAAPRSKAGVAATALLLGDERRIVVNVARPLARQGIRVVLALSADAPMIHSRAIARVVRLPPSGHGPSARIQCLVDIAREEGETILFACSDSALTLIVAGEDALRSEMRVAAPPGEALHGVLQKDQTLALAERYGVVVPAEFAIASRTELYARREELRFPLVAKPRDKMQPARFKVRYYTTFDALDQAFAEDPDFGRTYLLQEYCPGDGVLVGVVMQAGRAISVVQHRRLRELPASGGVAVLAATEPADPCAERQSLMLLRALGWEGVAAVEFRHDRATGRWVLMEINGRFWGAHAITQHAGVDFPWLAWQVARGDTTPDRVDAQCGVQMLWIAGDLQRAYDLARGDALGLPRPSRWSGLAQLWTDVAHLSHTALWQWPDARPGMDEIAHVLRSIAVEEGKRAARAALPPWLRERIRRMRSVPPRVGA